MDLVLSSLEVRVLGSLIEKQITTPDYYPLTMNALVAACSQKNNRNPVMALGEKEVTGAIDTLRDKHLAWLVDSAGSRVPKYSHNLPGRLTLTEPQVAVLCELMIRGPQTSGELRVHCERMHDFKDIMEVEATLESLATYQDGPLVVKLPRETGNRERRYGHLLCGAAEPAQPETPAGPTEAERLLTLENEVGQLRKDIDGIRQTLADFKKQFE